MRLLIMNFFRIGGRKLEFLDNKKPATVGTARIQIGMPRVIHCEDIKIWSSGKQTVSWVGTQPIEQALCSTDFSA